jgi:hypothetical protein
MVKNKIALVLLLEERRAGRRVDPRYVAPLMKVFISWSGQKSRDVAAALRDWLPLVINSVEPFVSSRDINAGARWQVEVAKQLDATDFGIVCVSKENQESAWLNFEAGALAKALESSRVIPLAIDLKPSDVNLPLGQFQALPATQAGIGEVLSSLNAACVSPLNDAHLSESTKMWWPALKAKLQTIERSLPDATAIGHERTERALLEEVLDTVRSLAQSGLRAAQADEPGGALRPIVGFAVGDRVVHPMFGSGKVARLDAGGIVVVQFEGDAFERNLLAELSRLARA